MSQTRTVDMIDMNFAGQEFKFMPNKEFLQKLIRKWGQAGNEQETTQPSDYGFGIRVCLCFESPAWVQHTVENILPSMFIANYQKTKLSIEQIV